VTGAAARGRHRIASAAPAFIASRGHPRLDVDPADFDLARHIGELAALLRHTTGRQAVTFGDLTAR
jgi:hypothetical protein